MFRNRRQGALSPLPRPSGGPEPVSVREVIGAVYRGVLSRPATETEIEQAFAALDSGQPLSEVITSVVNLKVLPELKAGQTAADDSQEGKLINDASQFGEIEMLIKQVFNTACPTRILVDVGANGIVGSNSYDLLRHFSWRGVLIDANPRLMDRIKEHFAGLDFELEVCAVSDYEGEATFCIGISDGVSSLDEASAAYWGPVADRLCVPVRRLAPILEQHSVPLDFDLLSLDIELHDVRVLNDLVGTSAYRPKWIIMEAPAGAFLNDLTTVGCSLAVQAAYTVVDWTLANFILRRTGDGAA